MWKLWDFPAARLLEQCIFVLASLLAGLALFSVGFNRLLVRLRQGRSIKKLTLGTLVCCLVGSAIFGIGALECWGTVAWSVPFLVLGAATWSELRENKIQRGLLSTQPEVTGNSMRLLQPVTTMDLIVSRYRLSLEDWAGPAVRVVQLSDLHVNDQLPLDYYQEVVRKVNAEDPDLVLVTGDFITFKRHISLLPAAFNGLEGRLGVFGVLGNHDLIKAAEEITATAQAMGINMIGGKVMPVPGHPNLALAGDEYPWGVRAPLKSWSAQKGEILLVLTHTPDNIYRLTSAQDPPAIVFGGHFHGGQLRLPILGPVVVPSLHGRRFAQGHFKVNRTHLFVSAGIGVAVPPIRIFCQPEIIVVDISSARV